MRVLFWLACTIAFDHVIAACELVRHGPDAARYHLRRRVYGWPSESDHV